MSEYRGETDKSKKDMVEMKKIYTLQKQKSTNSRSENIVPTSVGTTMLHLIQKNSDTKTPARESSDKGNIMSSTNNHTKQKLDEVDIEP